MAEPTDPPNTQVKKKIVSCVEQNMYFLAAILTTLLQAGILYIY